MKMLNWKSGKENWKKVEIGTDIVKIYEKKSALLFRKSVSGTCHLFASPFPTKYVLLCISAWDSLLSQILTNATKRLFSL